MLEINSREPIDLSIVIVSYNVSNCLGKCIDSIYKNSGIKSQEIIVVDNASTDGTPDKLRNNYQQVKLIENRENLFVPRANNQGIKISSGKYILMLNPDVIISPGTLKTIFDFLENNQNVGAAGPKLVNNNGEFEHCVALKRTFGFFLYNYTFLKKIFKKKVAEINRESLLLDWQRDTDRDAEIMIDVCLMVRRDVFKKVGLYDESFKLYFADDDLSNRITEEGYRIRFLSSLSVTHLRHQSLNRISKAQIINIYQKDAFIYAKKYFGIMRAYLILILMALSRQMAKIKNKFI